MAIKMKTHYCPAEKTTITFENTCNWCDETEMKQTHKIAYDYAMALLTQNAGEAWIQRAFNTLGSENQVFSVSDPLRKAYAELVKESIGEHLWDWLEWWMYDTDFGEKDLVFSCAGQEYSAKDVTLYKFLETVDV